MRTQNFSSFQGAAVLKCGISWPEDSAWRPSVITTRPSRTSASPVDIRASFPPPSTGTWRSTTPPRTVWYTPWTLPHRCWVLECRWVDGADSVSKSHRHPSTTIAMQYSSADVFGKAKVNYKNRIQGKVFGLKQWQAAWAKTRIQ